MQHRPGLNELTAAQDIRCVPPNLQPKAVVYHTRGFARDAYHRLAIRYAALAARREIEERPATRH